VRYAILVDGASLNKVPEQGVSVVSGLASVPMKRTAGVVLLVSNM
jgi:hypothetical protein